jgi:hypothetical protein
MLSGTADNRQYYVLQLGQRLSRAFFFFFFSTMCELPPSILNNRPPASDSSKHQL